MLDFGLDKGAFHSSFCDGFAQIAREETKEIEKKLLEQDILGTDATVMVTGGKRYYIRVFNNPEIVFYQAMKTKTIKEMEERTVLPYLNCVLVHDHEVALYHFGKEENGNSECIVHAERYNRKDIDETGNLWPWMMNKLFGELLHERKIKMQEGETSFSTEEIEFVSEVYTKILALGWQENKNTRFEFARKDEQALLNRYAKYKSSHLLFLTDFRIPPDNNLSERNLRGCKIKKKVTGGFRTFKGLEDYSAMKTVIENLDLHLNVLKEIEARFERNYDKNNKTA